MRLGEIKVKSFDTDGSLIVRGIASSNKLDRDKDKITITPNALKEAWELFKQMGAKMLFEHGQDPDFGNEIIGTVLDMQHDKEEYDIDSPDIKPLKIIATCKITDPRVIAMILSGEVDSFSLSWKVLSRYIDPDTGDDINREIFINELTACKMPANPEAKFTVLDNTDMNLMEQYGFEDRFGQTVEAYGQTAKVKGYAIRNGEKYYNLAFDNMKVKSYVKDDKIKAYTTAFDDSSMDSLLKQALKKKIKEEGYDIPASEIDQFTYNLKGNIIFGKNKRMSTRMTVSSDGKAIFHTRITNASKKPVADKRKARIDTKRVKKKQ